jgi:hypothetical protein
LIEIVLDLTPFEGGLDGFICAFALWDDRWRREHRAVSGLILPSFACSSAVLSGYT